MNRVYQIKLKESIRKELINHKSIQLKKLCTIENYKLFFNKY